jgi:hypothetical protein
VNVVVLGASSKPDRYSYLAVERLTSHGHTPVPVHPREKIVQGIAVFPSLEKVKSDFPEPIDTITVYVNRLVSSGLEAAIAALAPRRVIFNPGAENPELCRALEKRGIRTLEACTLVLLSTGQF